MRNAVTRAGVFVFAGVGVLSIKGYYGCLTFHRYGIGLGHVAKGALVFEETSSDPKTYDVLYCLFMNLLFTDCKSKEIEPWPR